MFADDIVLLAESMERLAFLFGAVKDFCAENRLAINAGKTKVLLCGSLRQTIPAG